MTQQHQPGRRTEDAGREHRSVATITGELREVERHLVEVPPHHGGGRADLSARADALRRELAAAERARTAVQQQQAAQQ